MVEVQVKKQRLRDVRAQLRLTQLRLAELAGVSEPTATRAESGRLIKPLTAQAILDAINTERAKRGWDTLRFDDLDWKIQGE